MRYMSSIVLGLLCNFFLTSCGTSSAIQPYASSKSHFINEPKLMPHNYPVQSLYRIYHCGATGFVPVSALRSSAEERAEKFCARKGCRMEVVGEKRTIAFPLPGNFPAIELVFAAVPYSGTSQGSSSRTTPEDRLIRLKKLRDSGVITNEEFEAEKQTYLNSGR